MIMAIDVFCSVEIYGLVLTLFNVSHSRETSEDIFGASQTPLLGESSTSDFASFSSWAEASDVLDALLARIRLLFAS